MRLLVNLGNSDLKLYCKNSSHSFIFRNRDKYILNLSELVKTLESKDIEFDETGNIRSSVVINIYEETQYNEYEIDRIDFPILQEEIRVIEEYENSKVKEILCFITKQEEHVSTDTFLLKEILLGNYGKTVFSNIDFKFATIKINPADYGLILPLYSEFISKINLDNTVISIAQGTPAMCLGLSQSCARYRPSIKQYYASNKHDTDGRVEIKVMDCFSIDEKNRLINQLAEELKNGNYDLAKNNVANNYLSSFDYINDIIEYFISRKNYKFEDALKKLKSLSSKTDLFDSLINKISDNLNCIILANPEEFDYSNEMCPYLLYESLANVKLSLIKKDYFYTMALLTSFLDVIGNFIILKALCLKTLTYKQGSFMEINQYIVENINILTLSKNKYDKLIKVLGKKDNIQFNSNFFTRKQLLNWIVENKEVSTFVNNYYILCKKYKGFIPFSTLRNQLPIAHSVKGISLESINNSLNNNKIEDLINDLYSLIGDYFSNNELFSPYYLDSDSFISLIKSDLIDKD